MLCCVGAGHPGSVSIRQYECGDVFVAVDSTVASHLTAGAAVGAGSAGAGSSGNTSVTPAIHTRTPFGETYAWRLCHRQSLPVDATLNTRRCNHMMHVAHLTSPGANQVITNTSLLIPWESGSRVKLPLVKYHIASVASIQNLHLDGGPSSVYCPQVRVS